MNHKQTIPADSLRVLENSNHFLETSKGRHPQKIAREICDIMGCDPLHKDRVPAFRDALERLGVEVSERRARSIYNGEVARLWEDERDAMNAILARLKATKDRATYSDAAIKISRDLAAYGCPLTSEQEQVISRSLH